MKQKKVFDILHPDSETPNGETYPSSPPPLPPKAIQATYAPHGVFEKSKPPKLSAGLLSQYGLFIFFAGTLSFFELIFRLWIFKNISADYILSALFALPAAAVFFLASAFFPKSINKVIMIFITLLLVLIYGTQLVYYSIFHTPLSLYSLVGSKDAAQFGGVALSAVLKNAFPLLLLFIPLVFLFLFHKKFSFSRARPFMFFVALCFGILSWAISIVGISLTRGEDFSAYALYHDIASPELSIRKLGVLTTMRLDLKRLVFGFEEHADVIAIAKAESVDAKNGPTERARPIAKSEPAAPSPQTHNMTDINFENLINEEKNQTIRDMHQYFSSVQPTAKNAQTGIFRGNNLIFIVAESFSPYAISPELTPTLYKLSTEGIRFNNFYNPIWGVSTSDGEYVSDMGLLPKSGVWSMSRSSKNSLPFTLGNQFKKLGYITKAFHDHTYTYYDRDSSMPNLGYDYKGVGNGVNVKKTWPESDLEMIEVTADEYTHSQPFHTYYMTVSGHMEYNFLGNYIAKKNKSLVADLPYSDPSKAYIAANLELEFAIKALIDKLEKAGSLENTVIAIVPDHYPYGLPKESLDELAGHELENNFELYKSIFILWKKDVEPMSIDKPASTLDILPTLSNLFGLEYDSRLLMGHDVFSDTPPLVIFLNRSWIANTARYNSTESHANESESEIEYEKAINKIIADKFKYSAKILETNYFSRTHIKIPPQG